MRRASLALLLALFAVRALGAYDANGVALGASERDIKKAFPGIYCKALEWKSEASDRRCDEAKVPFAGAEARITFYLKADRIQAFDVRFETKDLEKIKAFLRKRYGEPVSEAKEGLERAGKGGRQVYQARWEAGKDRAVLAAQLEKKHSQLTVSRGNWEEEIYRVR